MKIKLPILFCIVYLVMFLYLLAMANNYHNALWLIAIMSVPSSLVADVNTKVISAVLGFGHKLVLVDAFMLFIYGILQYWIIGYILGLTVEKIINYRKKRLKGSE